MTLALQKAPDILADIGASSPRPFIVAFAAETDDPSNPTRAKKLVRKNADLIIANDVADASIGFDSDQNAVTVIARDGSSTKIERAPKIVIANSHSRSGRRAFGLIIRIDERRPPTPEADPPSRLQDLTHLGCSSSGVNGRPTRALPSS